MSGRHRRSAGRRGAGRVVVLATALALLLGGTGVAWAAWSASGVGTAGARAVTAKASAAVAGVPDALLYPRPTTGYPTTGPGTIAFTLDNPNPYPVTFTSLTVGAVTTGTSTCPGTSVTGAQTIPPFAVALPANAPATSVTLPGVLAMDINAPTGCQGAVFTVVITLAGTSSTT
ncbi:MAG: hypothetical protein F2825_06255 [Actinobacteria bacterium]|uniref:Unannotated protein n=1 Tax=freshwater metagenome TaxID=449393 RepID=A0A6J7HL72_9ZZZZ|nr:hypothetical protein [Actinomycetota bacterium]